MKMCKAFLQRAFDAFDLISFSFNPLDPFQNYLSRKDEQKANPESGRVTILGLPLTIVSLPMGLSINPSIRSRFVALFASSVSRRARYMSVQIKSGGKQEVKPILKGRKLRTTDTCGA